jgi:hypothetical protein
VKRWVALLLVLLPGTAAAQAKPRPSPRAAFELFAFPDAALRGNRVQCGVSNDGHICTFVESSGGSWPKPYDQQYVFTSGMQAAAIIPLSAGFMWAGDTVGVLFADARGDVASGAPRADVFSSTDTADAANWPPSAVLRDAAVYDARLIGRDAASEQDLWTRYWTRPVPVLGSHPMGLLVDQRLLAWNYPTGNADVVYIVYTLYNVTARNPAAYANPTIPPELQSEIAAAGAAFQDTAEAQLAVTLPDQGYGFDSMYVGFYADADIAEFSTNYSTASLPFGLGIAYDGRFRDNLGWTYPAEIFGTPPFAPAPGLLGAGFLRSPAPFAMFTTFTGGAGFPDPNNVPLLWRQMSGNLTASDSQCNPFTDPAVARARHVCYVGQIQRDTRFRISAGPLRLPPGEATTLVVAYVLAAPLDTVNAFIGGDLKPGIPFTGDSIAADTTKILTIERAAGWLTQNDANGNGVIEAREVVAVRRSLLHTTQVAQAIVDAKFLLPSAPEPPQFFLVPGDNQVTVVWQRSATETAGDPYYPLASDPTSALYDPNYRHFDVEGYRIYRGRDPRALELIAQVDHDNTTFVDYLGALAYPGRCAPELGILTDCPAPFPPNPAATVSATSRIQGTMIQVPEGHRFLTSNGALSTVLSDTFPTGHASGFPPLEERGVPFTFADSGVRNSFRYYYAVTAFDFNSIRSGPSSFESARFTKIVTPRAPSGQETGGSVQPMRLLAANGAALDLSALPPTINPSTGVFSGPMPPTDGIEVTFSAFLPQLVGNGSVTVTIDSIGVGVARLDAFPQPDERPTLYYLSAVSGSDTTRFTVPLAYDATLILEAPPGSVRFEAVALDSAQGVRFGGNQTFSLQGQVTLTAPSVWRVASWGRAGASGAPANSAFNGPRWWAGASNETTPNPNGGNCAPANSQCGTTVKVPNVARTAGDIAGVTILHVQSYSSVPNTPGRLIEGVLGTVTRAADFRVVWGAGGAIDSVFDVTHGLPVAFRRGIGPTWGLLTQSSFAAVDVALTRDANNLLLTWSDIFCVDPIPTYMPHPPSDTTKVDCGGAAQSPAVLQDAATLTPIAIRDSASSYAGTAAAGYTATGNGFIFYLNGHFFLMQMASLPAAGTVWHARFYSGTVTGSAAAANFAFVPAGRPPAVPGLRAQIAFQGSQLNRFVTTDSLLAAVHTVPDPFYVSSGYELSADTLALKFVHLPARAIIRIYSVSGILVAVLAHDDPGGGGEATWDLNSRSGKRVASGVYFYHIETPDRRSRVGRFTVITGPRRGP